MMVAETILARIDPSVIFPTINMDQLAKNSVDTAGNNVLKFSKFADLESYLLKDNEDKAPQSRNILQTAPISKPTFSKLLDFSKQYLRPLQTNYFQTRSVY